MRHAAKIAAFACASLTLGGLLAQIVPTQIKTARNSELDRLSQPQFAGYSGQDRVITGPDSYPVTYSPQWLAVAEQAERERLAQWALPEFQPIGYDQPSPERDLAVEAEGIGEAEVHYGTTDSAEPTPAGDLDGADQPEG